ncbi:MAG: hypothetical protein J7L51_04165 [Desulfurococcales archaeon]|nr:hypothetical protein [Desulfurococcales archaeon]
MGKAAAIVVAAIIIVAALYMLYSGEFTSIISYIVPSSSPSGSFSSSTTVAEYTSVTSTTELSSVVTNYTSKTIEVGKTTVIRSLTPTETTVSKTIATFTETESTHTLAPPNENATETNRELVSISAGVTHLFSVDIAPLFRHEQAFLYTNGTHIIAGGRGLIVSIAFYRPESTVPSYEIVPVGERKPTTILADYVYINSSSTLLVVKLSKVLHIVNPGEYTVVVWSGYAPNIVNVLECKATVKHASILFDDVKIREVPIKVSCGMAGRGEVAGYLTSLVCYYNPSTLEKVRNIIYGSSQPESIQEKIWRALEWVDRNIVYDYEKSKEALRYVNNPLTTIEKGKGVCIDYSILVTSALLSVNVQPAYILSLEDYQHAVAAVCLNGTVFILDQHIPPMELQDHVEYVLRGKLGRVSAIQVSLAGGSPTIEVVNDIILNVRDSYPDDSVPDKIDKEVAAAIAETYPNLLPDSRLYPLIVTGLLRAKLAIKSPTLAGIETSSEAPIMVFYNPLFEAQWVKYLADKASELMLRYYADVIQKGGYLWVTIENGSIYLAATTYRVPDVTLTKQGPEAVIEIKSQETLSTVSVLLYKPGEVRPVAGIAPEGYTYSDITTITAKVWNINESTAKIVFITQDVAKRLAPGKYILAIWINGRIAWGTWYTVR